MIMGLVLLAWTIYLQQKIPFVFAEKISYIKINVTPINEKTAHKLTAAWATTTTDPTNHTDYDQHIHMHTHIFTLIINPKQFYKF